MKPAENQSNGSNKKEVVKIDEQNFRDLWFLSNRGHEDQINISWDDWQSKLKISVLSLCFVRFLHKSQIISLFILSSFFSLHPFFNTPPGASNDCRRRHESSKNSPTPQTPLSDNKSAILRTNVTLRCVYKTAPETGLSYLRARSGPRRLPALLRQKNWHPSTLLQLTAFVLAWHKHEPRLPPTLLRTIKVQRWRIISGNCYRPAD